MRHLLFIVMVAICCQACGQKNKTNTKAIPVAPGDSVSAWKERGEITSFLLGSTPPVTIMHNGIRYMDTTGMAVEGRKVIVGDTLIPSVHIDTLDCVLLVYHDGKTINLRVLKVEIDKQWYRFKLYEDTVTKQRFTGNMGMGFIRSAHYQPPYKYFTLSREPLPSSIQVLGEVYAEKQSGGWN